jgi:UDP-N-acetylglucosamine 2-epimerase (non-hydrolysing)
MKVLTITGTRPELIRLSVIMRKLDEVCEHIHVYTNQNFDPNLSTIFFQDLRIREPNYMFKGVDSIGKFLGNGFIEFEKILNFEKPDKILILGDTNSTLFVILAAKRGIPIYHMEAGNRCYDLVVPEETNRLIIDACSLFNLPYTENSKENLIREGHSKNFVFRTGNPINEVLKFYESDIVNSRILHNLGLMPHDWPGIEDPPSSYALLSLHRTENVDSKIVSKNIMDALSVFDIPIIFPMHPRTKDQFRKNEIEMPDNVRVVDPIGFFDFVKLEKHAKLVITDSGTVPEETSLFGVPCIVLRNTTERQELMENGSLILAGTKKEDIIRAYNSIGSMKQPWYDIDDYSKMNVSDTVIRILMGQNITILRKG